jgi:hypothetical protein
MSDLQDIIVKSSINAFNSGYLQGQREGRADVVEILQKHHDNFTRPTSFNYRAELKKIIEEIQNDKA